MGFRKLFFVTSMIAVFTAQSAASAPAWRDDRSGHGDHNRHQRDFGRDQWRDRGQNREHNSRYDRGHDRDRDRRNNFQIFLGQSFGHNYGHGFGNGHGYGYGRYPWPARQFYSDRHYTRSNYTLIGLMFGGRTSYGMTPYDYGYAANVFEVTPSMQTVAWRNPDSDTEYQLTPVRTYQANNGQYCREYQASAIIGGQPQETYGTACRSADGSWRIMN